MDFILGILTGVVLCIAYGHYATERARRHQREQQRQMFEYFFGGKRPEGDLEQQLAEAVKREDFKEAAWLRDLINKK